MKQKVLKKFMSMIIFCIMLVGLFTGTAFATNVSDITYASNLVDNDDIVLIDDTILYVNADRTLNSISGDYDLEIQSDGVHTLTVNNPNGCAISVKSLESTVPSQGTVNLTVEGGDGYFAIATDGDISLNKVNLDVTGDSGIRSLNGDVTINGTNVSVIGQNGVGVIANSGSISIDSDYLFVQCAAQSGDAKWEHGIGAVNDVTINSKDATIAGRYGVYSQTGNITLGGKIDVGATKCAIESKVGTITMTGSITAQGGDSNYAIYAEKTISFNGTTLNVNGGAGIRSYEGDITIDGKNVSVVGQDGVGVIANGGSISINSDYLFVQCEGQSGYAEWEHGIGAVNDVTINSKDATIAGLYGVESEKGKVSLTGNFWIGASKAAIIAEKGSITVSGDLTANNADEKYYCIVSGEGNITLSDGTIDITSTGNAVITHNGNIYLNGNITVTSSENDSCAINARGGDIVVQGGSLDVTGGAYALGASGGQIAVNQPLGILAPVNGHIDTNNIVNNASIIVDANDDPASHVEIGQAISGVSININAPVAGNLPASKAKDVYGLPEHCKVESIEWYIADILQNNKDPFIAGQNYKVKITLAADAGFKFAGGEMAKLNGKDATTGIANGGEEMIITYTFSDCPDAIKNLELTINAPVDGTVASYSASDESSAYSVGNGESWISWYVADDGVNYTRMNVGDKFTGGKHYKVEIDVATHTGYEFALDGNLDPDVSATVNGFKASVGEAYDQDPSERITVTYIFGVCNDMYIEEINIVSVPKPVPGEKPVYTVAASGTGYHIQSKDSSKEVYEGGQYVDKYYIRNGIGWYDLTANDWIYETDSFIAGHDYQCIVYVQTDNGYEFIQDLYANPQIWPTATVNGNPATIKNEGSGLIFEQEIRYPFAYEIQNVSYVEVYDIDEPVAGLTPDYSGELGNEALYEFAKYGYENAGYWWYDSEDTPLTSSDTFELGKTYKLEIKLDRKMDGQTVLTQFSTPVTARLNGENVNSGDVAANTTNVYIYYTYTCETAYQTTYNIIVTDGTASVEGSPVTKAKQGALITLTADAAPSDKVFDKWVVTGTTVADINSETTTFVMPKGTVNARATYKDAPVHVHVPGNTWMKNETHHWYVCTADSCSSVIEESKQPHTPDHNGGATEEYAVTCTACGYVIEAQLGHVCVPTLVPKKEADCATNKTGKNAYYACTCGKNYSDAAGQNLILNIETWGIINPEHNWSTAWDYVKENGHAHKCLKTGCTATTSIQPHNDSNADGKCDICSYVIDDGSGNGSGNGGSGSGSGNGGSGGGSGSGGSGNGGSGGGSGSGGSGGGSGSVGSGGGSGSGKANGNWRQVGNNWYYYDAKGTMQKGWLWDADYNSWFYLNENGVMQTGWLWDANYNSWFYMNANGTMHTGWLWDANYNSWFYMNANGTMHTGWLWDANYNAWYYLDANGYMLTNTTTPDGYYVGSDGKWVA